MVTNYQDVYPEAPLLNSSDVVRPLATELLRLEFFEAEPGEMPYEVFSQHHILINLSERSHRVENKRDGVDRDFIFQQNEIIVTPAGIQSGWKWHGKSKVIVITLDPTKLDKFVQSELGLLLDDQQLKDVAQFVDQDITQAGIMLMDALKSDLGSDVMFESFARIFLTKLIHKYGLEQDSDLEFNKSFSSKHYKRVLEFIKNNFSQSITLEDMASQAGISPFHFSRLFKKTIGQSPHQFVIAYRIEQAKIMLNDKNNPMIDIALNCGFADQAHFSRVFKQLTGLTPKNWRQAK